MAKVRVEFHVEPEGWWAESPDVPGYVASADTLGELRTLVREGLPFFLEVESVDIVESGAPAHVPFGGLTEVANTSGAGCVVVTTTGRSPGRLQVAGLAAAFA